MNEYAAIEQKTSGRKEKQLQLIYDKYLDYARHYTLSILNLSSRLTVLVAVIIPR